MGSSVPVLRRRALRPVLLAMAAAVAVTGTIAGTSGVPAAADPVDDRRRNLNRELSDVRENLEGTASDLVDAVVDLKTSKAKLVDARAQLAAAQTALQAAQARDRVLGGRLAVAEAAVEKAGRDLGARRARERDTRHRLGSIAREAYVSSGMSGLSIALDAASPEQFADRVAVAGTALRQQNGTIARLEVQQAETRARQERLDAARIEVARLKRESAAQVVVRNTAEQAATSAESEVSDLVDKQGAAVRTIAARKAAEEKRLAELKQQQDRLAALLRARAKARAKARAAARARARARGGSGGSVAPAPAPSGGRLSYPVGAPVTSGFGMRYHPVLHYWRLHAGTDFGAPCGTPVRAAAGGTIVRAGWAGGYGNQVVIDHGVVSGRDLASSYNHLTRFVVRSGRVRRGQLIAYSGTTGLSTGCHLHFEVYVSGTHVNPMNWL